MRIVFVFGERGGKWTEIPLGSVIEPPFPVFFVVFHLTYVIPAIWIEYLNDSSSLVFSEFTFKSFAIYLEQCAWTMLFEILHFTKIYRAVSVYQSAEFSAFSVLENTFIDGSK